MHKQKVEMDKRSLLLEIEILDKQIQNLNRRLIIKKKLLEEFQFNDLTNEEESNIENVDQLLEDIQLLNLNELKKTIVYCHGSCKNNGTFNAKASIGIYFGKDDIRNTSKLLKGEDKQTNNIAELKAVQKTLEIISRDTKAKEDYIILSNSSYVVNVLNGTCKIRENLELASNIKNMLSQTNVTLKWIEKDSKKYRLGHTEAIKLSKNALK